jgi:hypothetical protein
MLVLDTAPGYMNLSVKGAVGMGFTAATFLYDCFLKTNRRYPRHHSQTKRRETKSSISVLDFLQIMLIEQIDTCTLYFKDMKVVHGCIYVKYI